MIFHQTYYNFIVYIYALSLLFISADLYQKNRRAKQFGTGLLAFVWLLQTVFIVSRTVVSGYLAVHSMFETLFFFSWILCTAAFILQWIVRSYGYPFFISLSGFLLLMASLFFDPSSQNVLQDWHKERHFITIHVLFAISGYAVFSISAVFSGTYLFLHRKLKERKWSLSMQRLPSLDRIDLYAFRSVMIGVLLLLCSLIFGLAGIVLAQQFEVLTDVKVLSTVVLLTVYCLYALLHYRKDSYANRRAWYNMAAYAVLMINMFVTNVISRFH
ncbi:cytochrome c biogenesis protein CcsA [Marinicrinis lubricantis]|uniref:Cytochrome c biogenesis protein CcsA n=1 Tax=Marinicrinis lubricantis TaxID=2086470 RepID=A0ABW1ITT5_9BACL